MQALLDGEKVSVPSSRHIPLAPGQQVIATPDVRALIVHVGADVTELVAIL